MKIGGDYMRLIDADALMEHLFNEIKADEPLVCAMETHIKYKIDNAPTIDAVPATIEGTLGYLHKVGWMQEHDRIMTEDVAPVVRCKDCKGSEVFQNDSSGVMARYCKAFTIERMVADNDYCSYGERKEDVSNSR